MITFRNLFPELKYGMDEYIRFHGIEHLVLTVEIENSGSDVLTIEKRGDFVKLSLPRPYTIFRALTIVRYHLEEAAFSH